MVLKQVNKPRLAEIVEKQIREYIQNKKLQPGDLLPGEIELTKQLGVSRSVLREALSHLRMLGMLESKQCRGMVVSEPAVLRPFENIITSGIISKSSSQDLFELRLILEMGISELVFIFVNDDYIKKLEGIVQKSKKYPVGSARAVACDIEFHKTLYDITGNKILIEFHGILCSFFEKAKELIADASPDRIPQVSHEELLGYIKNKDNAGFILAMRKHLEQQFKLILKNRKIDNS